MKFNGKGMRSNAGNQGLENEKQSERLNGRQDRAFKGVWICAAVWTNPDLSWIEKALIAEIDSLVRDEAPCYASNDHLAKRIGVSVSRMNDMLARLQKAGFLIRIQYDGRTTHRVVSSGYSSNPETAKRWISQRRISTPAGKVSRNKESRIPENGKTDFLLSGNLNCEHQEDRVPNNKALYIDRIPEETPTLETTTISRLRSDNENVAANEATEESSSRRLFEGENFTGSMPDQNCGRGEEDGSVVESLVREFRLSDKQRRAVDQYRDALGIEYLRSKADIVRSQPRRNCAGALMVALRDDWQPPIAIGSKAGLTRQRPVRAGNRNIGNSNEYCDFSQYRSRD
jgi:hypothetical protein